MSSKQKQQTRKERPRRQDTQAFRTGFMNGYTRDNPGADPSISGFYAGYMARTPKK
jgi:hypothetical protein